MPRPPSPPPPPCPLSIELAGLSLSSPLIGAAGTCGVLDEMGDVMRLSKLGAIVTKSITRHPRIGNPFPRITFTRAGMLNAIGLANPGIDAFIADECPRITAMPCRVIGSIAGDCIEDYCHCAQAMGDIDGIAMIELNVSCPNVHSGLEFGADPVPLAELVSAVTERLSSLNRPLPLFVKLSPITVGTPHTIVDLAEVALDAGASGLTLTNTVPAMGINVHTRQPILSNITGGLSGPAIHPIIVRLVHLVYSELARDRDVPIMAAGGITRWQDAGEFTLAGASAVQIGAANFANPRSAHQISRGLKRWVRQQGVQNITELVGQAKI